MFHTIIAAGNVGRDPEMRYTPSGQPVTSLSMACNKQRTGSNGEIIKETIWFRVTTWGKTAEIVNQYVKKGSKILIEGELKPDTTGNPKVYQKQDGSHGSSYEVTAQTVRFLSGKDESGHEHYTEHPATPASPRPPAPGPEMPAIPEDDIPF